MKKLFASFAVALALAFAGSAIVTDSAIAAKSTLKTCQIGKGKKAQKWTCQPDQTCCVGADGKGVCGIPGLGCL